MKKKKKKTDCESLRIKKMYELSQLFRNFKMPFLWLPRGLANKDGELHLSPNCSIDIREQKKLTTTRPRRLELELVPLCLKKIPHQSYQTFTEFLPAILIIVIFFFMHSFNWKLTVNTFIPRCVSVTRHGSRRVSAKGHRDTSPGTVTLWVQNNKAGSDGALPDTVVRVNRYIKIKMTFKRASDAGSSERQSLQCDVSRRITPSLFC